MSANPEASTIRMSASDAPTTAGGGGGEDVKLDLSEDEEGQEESSEVSKLSMQTWCRCFGLTATERCLCFQLLGGKKPTGGFWTFEYYESFFNVDTVQV